MQVITPLTTQVTTPITTQVITPLTTQVITPSSIKNKSKNSIKKDNSNNIDDSYKTVSSGSISPYTGSWPSLFQPMLHLQGTFLQLMVIICMHITCIYPLLKKALVNDVIFLQLRKTMSIVNNFIGYYA